MNLSCKHLVVSAFTLLVVAGCASTKVTSHEQLVSGDLPRPERKWVYNFGATPADLPADSELIGQYDEHTTPQTDEEIATGRELDAQIAGELVRRIREMGVPAERGSNLFLLL